MQLGSMKFLGARALEINRDKKRTREHFGRYVRRILGGVVYKDFSKVFDKDPQFRRVLMVRLYWMLSNWIQIRLAGGINFLVVETGHSAHADQDVHVSYSHLFGFDPYLNVSYPCNWLIVF